MDDRPTVLLAEDHAMVAQGLRLLLQDQFTVLGVITDGTEVVSSVRAADPDVLLLDLGLPGRNGLDLIPDLRRLCPRTRVLVVTMHADAGLARLAFTAGALGFVPKDCDAEELHLAIREVLGGVQHLSPRLKAHSQGPAPASPAREAYWRLSSRQQEILRAIAEGRTTQEIADQLGLSIHTVHFHRRRIRRVLGVASDDGLTRLALMMQIGPDGPPSPPSTAGGQL